MVIVLSNNLLLNSNQLEFVLDSNTSNLFELHFSSVLNFVAIGIGFKGVNVVVVQ